MIVMTNNKTTIDIITIRSIVLLFMRDKKIIIVFVTIHNRII